MANTTPTKITPENTIEFVSRYLLADLIPVVVDLEKSKGNRLHDARSGRDYLDCISYIASNPIGHNHPKMFESAFEKKLLRAARVKPSLSDFWMVEFAEFVDTFVRLAVPKEFPHLFFVEGGGMACENGLKVAFDWKVRLNQRRGITGETGAQVLHFKESFHGRTGYTLTLTNTADARKTKFYPKFQWPRITNPKIKFPLDEKSLKAVIDLEEKTFSEIESAFEKNGMDIAAIILEPIQAEGGDNHFRPEFHKRLREVADEYEVMLIYDEVQTGMGLTGRMWGYEHYETVPDIVCFGKKAQTCGIMVGKKVEDIENNVFVEKSRLNSTWGGSLVDMVRAEQYLKIIAQEKLVENASTVGDYILEKLSGLAGEFPNQVSNVRGQGLMCAFDLSSTQKRDQVFEKLFAEGVLVLKCGNQSIRLRPSLTFSKPEVDELISVIGKVLKTLA